MSFSKWIRGGSAEAVPSVHVDVGGTCYAVYPDHSTMQLRNFLEMGDLSGLNMGFVWSTSPQGWHYWHERYEGDVPVSEEDRDFIWALVRHFESGGGSRYVG